MNQLGFPILSLIVFLPLLGAVVVLFIGDDGKPAIRRWALAVALADFALSLVLYFAWADTGGMQFLDHVPWIAQWDISYSVAVDGISLFLVLLITFLTPIAVLASWGMISDRPKSYYFFLLLLETGVLGVFTAADIFLFYVFWEAMLVPMYFLIGRWGGERRVYATLKFFLYTMAGSALMLVAILVLGLWAGTFDLLKLYETPLPGWLQFWLFGAFALAFAVKAPLWPLHTWLPDAYVESPTPVTVLLAGVLSKMGVYGFLRFCLPLFPTAVPHYAPLISVLALVGIIYGSLVALAQSDVKRLIAYSSLAHVSLIVLGVFAFNVQTVQGSLIQMVSHGVNIAALFLLVGMLAQRRGTRHIADFGGLWKAVPLLGIFLMIAMLGSVGLPGLDGFVGEFTILVGVFRSNVVYAAIATLGIVLGAWYMFDLYRRVMHGPVERPENATVADLSGREVAVLVPLAVLIFLIGILPNLFFGKMGPSVEALVGAGRAAVVSVEK